MAGSYAYFVVLDVKTSSTSEAGIRVLRVCNNSYENRIASMSEIELDCLGLAGRVNGYARLAGVCISGYIPDKWAQLIRNYWNCDPSTGQLLRDVP